MAIDIAIVPYDLCHHQAVLELSIRAWAPVFPLMQASVSDYVYRAFYPDGWEPRQRADVATILAAEDVRKWVAMAGDVPVGWVGARMHLEDKMGEIHILAVDPDWQRKGIASHLMDRAMDAMRMQGLDIVMVETGGDPGHMASRATYERAGFERWPVARYFKPL
jgi:GNAT superfamily N-acetyltransferase